MKKQPSRRITRRQFLIGAGATLVGTTLACNRGRGIATTVSAPTTTPTPTTAHSPTPTITPTPSLEGPADLVLLNGKVITVDAADTIAQAVAIKNGCIQAVGSDEAIRALVGPETETVDLAGRSLTPGLIDAHNHFQVMGLMNGYYVPLMPPEVRTLAELQAKLQETVAQTPPGEWVKGYYLGLAEGRLPTRHDLDPISSEHPIWLMQQGGHYGSANSLALQIAGITADTPNPPGGQIGREANGEPNGVFYNHRAMDLVRRYIPAYTPEMVHENIVSTQPIFAAVGVTSFQDNNVRGVDMIRAYLETGKRGDMYLRGAVYFTLEWPKDLDRALNQMEHYQDEFMRFAGFKFLLDGQALMAYCHEPHNGVRWDMPTWEPQTFKDAVRKLHDTGLQICVHCIGDAAVDLTLDAYEEAMNANPRPDPRHRIEHAILTQAHSTQRMKDLGVVVSTQPAFIRIGGAYWPGVFGPERADRLMVTREWLESGVHLALGSDAPTGPWYTPQMTLAEAVARVDRNNQQLEPDQALTIQEALRAHTMGSAYAAHEENIKGSIEVGKLADLAVWSEDPYTAPLQRLWQIPIEMTLVGGEIVYKAV
ncbi:MAG: amidohydrolase [Anaerolineae bacterium]|nr:amidohydrolase [Anaerolineae bacterium]